MKNLKRLIGAAFILLVAILSLNSFTNSAHAKEATTFYKDLDETQYENLDVLLYTNGEIVYQIYREDEFFGTLYKLNIIDKNGKKVGTYSFPENLQFNTEYMSSHPVIDKNGNLLISYVKPEEMIYNGSFYLASISQTGKMNWEFETGFLGPTSPIFGEDGTIYFVTSDRKSFHVENTSYVYALTENGEEIWKKKVVGDGFAANPYINGDNNLVFTTRIPLSSKSLQVTYTLDGRFVDDNLTPYESSSFYRDGIKYHTEDEYYGGNDFYYSLIANDEAGQQIWYHSFDSKDPNMPVGIDHVTKEGVVYLTPHQVRSYDQTVYAIFNGAFNWKANGMPFYYGNDVYTLNLLKQGSNRLNSFTAISKLDTRSGKVMDTEVLNFSPSDAVAFDKDVMLFAVEKDIYKVSFDKNVKAGWVKKKGMWLYYDKNGILKTDWLLDNGDWYYLDSTGVMKTEWYKVNEKWYYSTSSGEMQTGWIKDKNKWYFLSSSGSMESGWIKDKGTWYYTSSDGAMQTGWIKDKGKWYFLSSNGAMKINWLQQGDKWYFLNSNGDMHTGWKLVNNKWYYFYSSGQMAANTTVDGYKLDKSGAWVR